MANANRANPSLSPTSLGQSPVQLQPASALGTLSTQAAEVRTLLQRRLAIMLPLGAVIWATVLIVGLLGVDPLFGAPIAGRAGQLLIGCTLAVWATATLVVWLPRELPLRWLRAIELVVLAVMAFTLAILRLLLYRHGLSFEQDEAGRHNYFLPLTAVYNGFGWMAMIVVWGLVIPDTWRRTAAIVLGVAACPLLVDVGLIAAEPARLWALGYPLLLTAQMLSVALVPALFASYRLSTMQQEVAEAREEARAARRLGPYTLKRRLGAGGMGEVYLAEHRLLKRACAVKLIHPERAGDPKMLARFDREVQATARLKHPSTVEIFDYGRTEDGTFYYVMEYLDGLALDEVVERFGPLPAARVVFLLRQLCGALREAHEAGLIHRDIKPSNILLCRHGGMYDVVKLVDFGLVQTDSAQAEASKLTQAGAITGTPDFMSPEQADRSGLGPRSDLYSLGATAFYLLTGRPPFLGKTVLDVLIAHRNQAVPAMSDLVAGIPADLEAVVRRCLAKSPEERFASADELDRALEACAASPSWSEEQARHWWASIPAPDAAAGPLADSLPTQPGIKQSGPSLQSTLPATTFPGPLRP